MASLPASSTSKSAPCGHDRSDMVLSTPRSNALASKSSSTSPILTSAKLPSSTSTLVTASSSAGMESRLLARFNECFRVHEQALRQVITAQEKQHDAIKENHDAVILEMGVCSRAMQFGMKQQQQSMSSEQPMSIQHLQEQEKRLKDYTNMCFQRLEDVLCKLSSSIDAMTQQQSTVSNASQQASLNVVSKEVDKDDVTSSLLETLVRMNGASQENSNAAPNFTPLDTFEEKRSSVHSISIASAPAPSGSAEMTTPLLDRKRTPMRLGADVETKITIQEMLEEIDEEDCADSEDFWPRLAHNLYYHECTIAMVILNLAWIGIEIDINHADILCDAPWYVQVIDNLFCLFFVVDITIRILASEAHSFNFWLDILLVAQMAWEAWIQVAIYMYFGLNGSNGSAFEILRVFRLMRVMRALRMQNVLSVVPQLMVLVRGIFAAMQSVCAILFLMLICIYFFAVVFTMLAKTQNLGGNFDTVPHSMEFFLVQIISGVDGDFISQMLEAGLGYYILFLMFVFIGTMTLMNMLIGVVCDVMSAVSSEEKEKLDIAAVEKVVADMVDVLDTGGVRGPGSKSLGQGEFEKLLDHPEIVKALAGLEVDVGAFVDFVRFATPEDEEISLTDLTDLVLQCRGNQPCTVKDIIDMRKFVAMETQFLGEKFHVHLDTLHATMRGTHGHLKEIHKKVHRMDR